MSDWTVLRSSNIKRCRYIRSMQVLFIQFLSGDYYAYWQIPWSLYMGFRRAKSHGVFLSKHFRDNDQFGCRKMHPEEIDKFFVKTARVERVLRGGIS